MIKSICRCKFLLGLWRYLCTIIGKLLCFVNKRKLSIEKNNESNVLMSIKIQGENCSNETNLVDWNTWEDGGNKGEDTLIEGDGGLFKDMEPTINKAKVVHIKKTIRAPIQESPLMLHSKVHHVNGNSLTNLNPKYQVESELGVLEDGTNGWDDEIDENFVSKETETILQTNKLIERERRLMEQKQKKVERDILRSQKRQDTYIGVKIK